VTSSDASFPIAAMVRDADSHADRARLVLRVPDAIVASHGTEIQDACLEAGFKIGALYITVRSALLNATPDKQGRTPPEYVRNAEMWRRALFAMSLGAGR
jgi:hypothetical protein